MKNFCVSVFAFVIGVLLQISVSAQAPADSLLADAELFNVSGALYTADHLSFNVHYYFEQKDSSSITTDSLSGQYKINGDKFYVKLDSTEVIQNANYNVAISHDSKAILISKPQHMYKSILQLDLFDTLFNKLYVDSVRLSDTSTFRKLTIVFKEKSPYSHYEIGYNKVTSMISWIRYRVRKGIPSSNASIILPFLFSAEDYIDIRIVFSNLQTQSFSDAVFNLTPIVIRNNGAFMPSAQYDGYDIFDQSDK